MYLGWFEIVTDVMSTILTSDVKVDNGWSVCMVST